MEKTLLIIKPDGVEKRLIGEILRRVEATDLKIMSLRMLRLDRETAGRFYAVHKDKDFYYSLID